MLPKWTLSARPMGRRNRRRSLAVAGVAAACAAIIPVAGCGSSSRPVQMGAAATIGNQRITNSTLSTQVAGLSKAYKANPKLASQLQYKPAQMPQLVLAWLVRFQVLNKVAQNKGIKTSPADSQRGLAAAGQVFQQETGQQISSSELALANAVPPGLMTQFGQFEATLSKLTVAYTGGKQPKSQQEQQQESQMVNQRLMADIGTATKSLHVTINPRYGQLNTSQLTITPAKSKLSSPSSSNG